MSNAIAKLIDRGIAAEDAPDVAQIISVVVRQFRRMHRNSADAEMSYGEIADIACMDSRRVGTLVKRYATILRAEPLKAEYHASGAGAFGNYSHARATRLPARANFRRAKLAQARLDVPAERLAECGLA